MGLGKSVTAPDGNVWLVRRRWLDRSLPNLKRRFKEGRDKDLEDEVLDNLPFFDWLDGWPGVVLSVAFILIVFVLLPLLGVTLELIALIFFLGSGLVGRFVFGRPWTVGARLRGGDERVVAFQVKGRRRAGRAATDLATQVRATGQPEHFVAPEVL
jgi:hypothetical protein